MKRNLIALFVILVLGFAAYKLWSGQQGTTLASTGLTEFAIPDTSQIGRFTITDVYGNVVDIKRRGDGFWSLNDSLTAMPHHVDVVLKTISRVGIQSPVFKSQKPRVMKILNGDNRKVQIYDLEENWLKTWYVGSATMSSQGTYALLETPEEGLSPDPYVIEIPGFRGFLTSRFHAKILEWRWTGLFHYRDSDIAKVDIETPRRPELGLSITVIDKNEGTFQVNGHDGKEYQADKSEIASILKQFKKVNVEHFNMKISKEQQDSILALPPDYRFSVTSSSGETQSADMYFRAIPPALKARMGDRAPELDPERVYVYFNGDLAYGQRRTFDNLLFTLPELLEGS